MRELLKPLTSFVKRLAAAKGGNAMMIVGLGLPVLVGGAGFGTDLAQWYMWKRELQFAADQGALAGAWAKASSKTAVQTTYLTRATQEYNANLGVIKHFDGANAPTVALANYGTGTNNSIVVTASATKRLPFSSIFTNGATTVSVRAQAVWNSSADFHACMIWGGRLISPTGLFASENADVGNSATSRNLIMLKVS